MRAKVKSSASKLKDKVNGDTASEGGDEMSANETEVVASVKEIPEGDPTARRTYFADAEKRKEIVFGPEVRSLCFIILNIS